MINEEHEGIQNFLLLIDGLDNDNHPAKLV